jgi:hypothetical protein
MLQHLLLTVNWFRVQKFAYELLCLEYLLYITSSGICKLLNDMELEDEELYSALSHSILFSTEVIEIWDDNNPHCCLIALQTLMSDYPRSALDVTPCLWIHSLWGLRSSEKVAAVLFVDYRTLF